MTLEHDWLVGFGLLRVELVVVRYCFVLMLPACWAELCAWRVQNSNERPRASGVSRSLGCTNSRLRTRARASLPPLWTAAPWRLERQLNNSPARQPGG